MTQRFDIRRAIGLCIVLAAILPMRHPHAPAVEFAYIGPGAGFAFLGSFLTLLGGLFLGAVSLLTWPFRMLWRLATVGKFYKKAKVKKLIFLGLDGLDPGLTERFMA